MQLLPVYCIEIEPRLGLNALMKTLADYPKLLTQLRPNFKARVYAAESTPRKPPDCRSQNFA